ncbi:hypothetical protein BDY24DRAFT_93280 [Mrakia frigida]|uniref:uncharacterized protein n=1 Tax=Mrakia frigida TaxID=29902 RepID=UPI003FCC18E5
MADYVKRRSTKKESEVAKGRSRNQARVDQGRLHPPLVQSLLRSFFSPVQLEPSHSLRRLALAFSLPLSRLPPMDGQFSSASEVLLASPGFLFLVGSLAVGIIGISVLLGVRSALRGRGKSHRNDEWNSRTPSPLRLPFLPPFVFLVPIFVFYPLSGIFNVTSIGKSSVSLHGLSVIFDGLGRGGFWLSLHLLLPFVAPYSPDGIEWWFRRGVDGLLLLLFTSSTITLLASPFLPSLEGAGLVVSHGLALALDSVVFLVLTFNNSPSIPRLLVLGQLAAQASDIQGMVSASEGGAAGFDVGRAACVVIWLGLAGAWYTSSIISSHLLGDVSPPVHDRRSRHSPYGGAYGQFTSGSSMGQFFGHVASVRPSFIELSPASFQSPELTTPNPAHDVGFRPFKMPVSDDDEVGIAISGISPYETESIPFPVSQESAGQTESLVDTVPPSRESQTLLSGLGLGSLRRGSSKSTTNLRGSPSGNALGRSTGSVDLLAERPSSSRSLRDRTSSTLPSLFKRSASPSPSLSLTIPSPDADAFEFDPFSRQQDQGAIKIQRHNSGYEPASVTTPRPSPREINFPAEINFERRPSQASLVTPELSFTVRAPSRTEVRSAVSSFNADKLNAYTFPQVPSALTTSTSIPTENDQEVAVVVEEPRDFNHSRWSTSASDLTLTKGDEWIKRDSYVRASLTPSEIGSNITPRNVFNGTPMSGIWGVVDTDVEEKMVEIPLTEERSPFSRMGSLLAARTRDEGINIPPPPVDIGRALTQLAKISEESPSPKSEKKRPSRLDLSPSSIFRRASGGTGSGPASPSPSPGGTFPSGSALDDLPSPSSYLSPGSQARQNLLRPSSSSKLNTSLISRPMPQSNRYPIGHILTHDSKTSISGSSSTSSSNTAGGQLVSPAHRTFRFGSPPSTLDGESPGPRTPTIFGQGAPPSGGGLPSPRPAARAAGRARAGTIHGGGLMVPTKGRGSMVSLSTMGSIYDGVPMIVAKREEGGRKGSVPNLTSTWL